ncbi:hypothetical protein [Hydrogenophaga sp.]|uniref:hypothetical protein n=1 Tax=Hydrogenophaga sp. TaxID=1904254 RepID=UPI002737562F|nr:hypothetical protein [Hydrogenophaga sp.]MDP3106955.1 hypothetical protein [Hydrogenophaga sp.]
MTSHTAALLDAIARGCAGDLINERLQAVELDATDLEQALGLDRCSRIRARNTALTEAAAVLSAGSPSPWQTACRLADAVARFESRIWPRCKRNPDDLGPLDLALRTAFLTGEKVPTSPKRLVPFVDTNAVQRPKDSSTMSHLTFLE